MSQFNKVIQEFQQKRVEKEIYASRVRNARLEQLEELAHSADMEMRQRRSKRRQYKTYS